MADGWNPAQYERFKAERSKPFHDLVAMVQTNHHGGRVVDLGCGTGELTASLAVTLGASEVLGIDSSKAMLADAAEHARGNRIHFQQGDIEPWTSAADWNVVISNAALHWVTDHVGVLGRWAAALAPGGQLAVQVPYNHDHPAHTIAEELRTSSSFTSFGIDPDPVARNVLSPDDYATLLYQLGFEEQSVRLHVYGHLMPDADAVVEWVKGSTLTRFSKLLPAEVYTEFERLYRQQLNRELGSARPYFYPFKRILMWAKLPD